MAHLKKSFVKHNDQGELITSMKLVVLGLIAIFCNDV